ncbi:glycosyltransferase family 2 protein [Streptomyces sp. NBC_01264]|uniref:glycosyltransferase family 2 protein n=1 Tax=Streptomyces sp. NBC_01264 TaxID=2903804 RepID=UPI002251CE37|nr:glycosyltransferase family A protein [Streptomyces sp. NBC_01264]MCX4780432.1 glycosyltransferase family 2 protein [Streptomyces sp. NBC_01264]
MGSFDFMLPYYGDVRQMQDAVRSVLAQTDRDFRLVVIDDGREPEVPGWFEGLGDARVSYLRNERNLGITKNFQKCVDLSEADHVVIMGCDDLLHPHYLETVRAILDAHPGIGMVQPGVEVIDGSGRVARGLPDAAKQWMFAPRVSGRAVMSGEELAASVLRGNWLYFPSITWRGPALRRVNFRDGYSVLLDLALVVDLLEAGERMVVDGATTVFQYRRHAASESSVQALSGTRFTESERYFSAVAERMEARGWPRAARAARLRYGSRLHALRMLPGALRRGNRAGVRTLARHAFAAGRG